MLVVHSKCAVLAHVALALIVLRVSADVRAECSLVSNTADASVTAGSTIMQLPALLPACEGARVDRGPVTACVRDARERLNCRTFKKGETIRVPRGSENGSIGAWFKALRHVFAGDPASQDAVTRGSDGSMPFTMATGYLPHGLVAFVRGSIDVPFGDAPGTSIPFIVFKEVETRREVARLPAIGDRKLDTAVFRAGRQYVWSVEGAIDHRLSPGASFLVVDTNGSAKARRMVARAHGSGTSLAEKLEVTALLHEAGFEYDAEVLAREMGERVGHAVR